MEYKVVYGSADTIYDAIRKLEKEVKSLIKEGYSLQGGVSVSENDCGWMTVCQAMVK